MVSVVSCCINSQVCWFLKKWTKTKKKKKKKAVAVLSRKLRAIFRQKILNVLACILQGNWVQFFLCFSGILIDINFWQCIRVALQSPEPVSDAHAAKFNPCVSYRHDCFSGRKIHCYFKSTLVLFALLCFFISWSINRSEMFDIRNWLFHWV